MVEIQYANAYKEVLEILNCISIEDYNKIPKAKIELFETYANNNYVFEYNPRKTLNKQDVSKTAKAIIGLLYRDYWATENQRNKIIAKQNYDRMKLEKEKGKKYNPNDIFKKSNQEPKIEQEIPHENVAMIEYKESIFKKIINKIKNVFHIN